MIILQLHFTSKYQANDFPANVWCCCDVSFWPDIGRDFTDHAEKSSQRRNCYVNETDMFENKTD